MKQIEFDNMPKKWQVIYNQKQAKDLEENFRAMGFKHLPSDKQYREHCDYERNHSVFFNDHGIYYSAKIEKL